MVKVCIYNPHIRCFWFRCDYVSFNGDVKICKWHPNPFGYFMRRKISPVLGGAS